MAEESEFHIVRTKRFSVKPMSPEEAILQMNLLDHDFYVFRNSDDDSISIVYHRKNGGYGLIVTDEEEDVYKRQLSFCSKSFYGLEPSGLSCWMAAKENTEHNAQQKCRNGNPQHRENCCLTHQSA